MIRLLIIAVSILVLALLCMSNTNPITIWFVSFEWPIKTGYFIAIVSIISLFIGFLVGWFGDIRQRHRARRAEGKLRSLEKENLDLHKRINQLQTGPSTHLSGTSAE